MTATPARPSRWLAAALAILMSGCSFVSVSRVRPPAEVDDPRVPDTCTASSGAAVADTVLGSVGLIAGYAMMLNAVADTATCDTTTTGPCKTPNMAPGLLTIGAAAVFAGSAIYGYVTTAQCRRHQEAGARCASGNLDACQKVKPGWMPPPQWRTGGTLAPMPPPEWQTSPPPNISPQPGPPGQSR